MKDTIKAGIAGIALGLSSLFCGYQGAQYHTQEHARATSQARERGLEAMLASTHPVVNLLTYEYHAINPFTGQEETRTGEEKHYGSMVGIFRDLEGRTYFLTSHHVTDAPAHKEDTHFVQPAPFVSIPVQVRAELKKQELGLLLYEHNDSLGYEELEVVATSEDKIDYDIKQALHYPDIALVRTKTPSNYPIWDGAWAQEAQTGDILYSIGYAGGTWDKHLTTGIIRSVDDPHVSDVLYLTTLPITPGNSGGPVFVEDRSAGVPTYRLLGLNRALFKENLTSGITTPRHLRLFLEKTRKKLEVTPLGPKTQKSA